MPSTNKTRVETNNRVPSIAVEDSTKEDELLIKETLFDIKPSAFGEGLTTQSPLFTGFSDDSDLPRLSPIRTRSETDLNTWERSKQTSSALRSQILEYGEEETLFPRFSLRTNLGIYVPKPGSMFGSHDVSDFSLSPEDAATTTNTSGNCSAMSEDLWSIGPCSDFQPLNSDIITNTTTATTMTTTTTTATTLPTITTDEQTTPTMADSSDRCTHRTLSSMIENITVTFNKGLFNLAAKVERATSSAARDFSGNMRCVSDIKPDNSFFEAPSPADAIGDSSLDSQNKMVCNSMLHMQKSISYDAIFNVNGGQDYYENMELLCNEYCKKLNKKRSVLPESQKAQLDRFLRRLYPIFDVVGSPTESEDECTSGDGDSSRIGDDQLGHFYESVSMIVSKSATIASQKERSSILEIANLVANPINVFGSGSTIPLTPQTSRCAELYVELEFAILHGRHSVELIHEDAVLQMAELSTCCVKCLLEIATDLTGLDPESPSHSQQIIWPDSGEEIASTLRTFGIKLIHYLETVTDAFLTALIGVGTSYDENLGGLAVSHKANALASDLESDSYVAVRKVQEILRNLMYVVAYATFTSSSSSSCS